MSTIFFECKQKYQQEDKRLNGFVGPGIFCIEIPKKHYEQMSLEKFYFGGGKNTGVAGLKAISGAALFLGMLASSALTGVATPLVNFFGKRLDNAAGKSKDATKSGERYGYKCQSNIPSEWVKGKINWELNNSHLPDSKTLEERNPAFKPSATNAVPIYVVSCVQSEIMYEIGTHYLFDKINSNSGHLVLFADIACAARFVKNHEDGECYDDLGGWRIEKPWTDQERGHLKKHMSEKIVDYINIPAALTNIITDYSVPGWRPSSDVS